MLIIEPFYIEYLNNIYNTYSRLDDINTEESEVPDPHIGAAETLIFREKDLPISCIRIAPCEGKTPLPLFGDSFAEEMSFPTIYAGTMRKFSRNVSYTDIAKSEARNYIRRACVPQHLLYAFKKSYNEKVFQAIQICMRKTTGSGDLNARNLRSQEFIENLMRKDEGYAVFKNIRSSPLYWRQKSKTLHGLIRQKGKCTFFVTLSAAETKWMELKVEIQIINFEFSANVQ